MHLGHEEIHPGYDCRQRQDELEEGARLHCQCEGSVKV